MISDISSLSQPVAYTLGIKVWYLTAIDGLKNLNKLFSQINKNLKPSGILIIPIISLSNTIKLKKF